MILGALTILAAISSTAISNDTARFANMDMTSRQEFEVITRDAVHRVMLIDVTEKGDMCGISVDGYTEWINVGDDARINGVYVKVFEAYPAHSQIKDNDYCKVFIGGGTVTIPFVQEVGEVETNKTSVVNETPAKNETEKITVVVNKTEPPKNLTVWEIIWNFLKSLFVRK